MLIHFFEEMEFFSIFSDISLDTISFI